MIESRLGLPHLGDGVGLRHPHYEHLMRSPASGWGVDWFEVISENHIGNHGYGMAVLERVRSERPVVMHGVSLSIGSSDPLDEAYLDALAALAERIEPAWVSDHLCWTGMAGLNTHDLLPMPLTEASLAHVTDRIRRVQDRLKRHLVVENPSSYLQFRSDQMPEWEYIARMADAADCGLLLDVNNVWVSSVNHGFDPVAYIEAIPCGRVVQVHLAGPTDCGTHFMDTHDSPVRDEVWELYRLAQRRTGGVSTLLEWDASIPPWESLVAELGKAAAVRDGWSPAPAPRELAHG
jgi:uncharacterized protein (UPF0276 family)